MAPLITTLIIYISVIFIIGLYAYFATRNASDYMLGGRSSGGAIAALGAGSSDMSSWLLLALPAAIIISGVNQIWLPIGLSIGAMLNWQFVAKRLRVYTEVANDSITLPAYFENRFHDHSRLLRPITAVVILIFFAIYVAAGFVSGAVLFSKSFEMSYTTGLMLTAFIIFAYTCIGGFLAISWIDFFQGTLMLIALILMPAMLLYEVGGCSNAVELISSQNIHLLDSYYGLTFVAVVSSLAWGLGYFGQPHIILRFMAIKSPNETPKAQMICMTWMNLGLMGAVFIGILATAYYHAQPFANDAEAQSAFILLSHVLFNPWVAGFFVAAVLSAVMSTVSAQLLASSTSLSEDIYHRYFRKKASQKEQLIASRVIVLIVTGIAVLIASDPESSILALVSNAWAGLGASFGPLVIISLFWRRMNYLGALAGIISGTVGVIIWPYFAVWFNAGSDSLLNLYELLPAFVLSTLAIIVVSLLTKKPSPKIEQEFDETMRRLSL